MSPYRLTCSVCKSSFFSRKDWLQHLLEEKHQIEAREECHQWLQDDNIKECVVLALATFPLASSSVLSHFSKGTTIVTDFVWWAHRQKIGLIQFESRLKVDEILKNGSLVTVDAQQVHLRRITEYFQLEWNELIPTPNHRMLETSHPKQIITSSTNVTTKKRSRSVAAATPSIQAPSRRTSQIFKQFAAVMKEVEINSKFGRTVFCRATLFRNWYLGYKNNGDNTILIFVECRKIDNLTSPFSISENLDFGKLFKTKTVQRDLFPNLRDYKLVKDCKSHGYTHKIKKGRSKFKCVGTSFEFTSMEKYFRFCLVNDPELAPEMYTCRLLQHMCLYDPIVKPLIYLVSYWARVNHVTLAPENDIHDASFAPEPALLEWLVVFFCCIKGIIPSPRRLMKVPHKPVMIRGVDVTFGLSDFLIRYYTDSTLVALRQQEGRSVLSSDNPEKLSINVCKFAQEFFGFCGDLGSEPCILNMRDGEVIKEKEFPRKVEGSSSTWDAKLTNDEFMNVQTKLETESPLTIIHPLVDFQGFSFDKKIFINQTCKIMKSTAKKLKTLCDHRLNGSGEDIGCISLEAALSL